MEETSVIRASRRGKIPEDALNDRRIGHHGQIT